MDISLSKLREIVKDGEAWCVVCSSGSCRELDTTERLNHNNENRELSCQSLMIEEEQGKDGTPYLPDLYLTSVFPRLARAETEQSCHPQKASHPA